MKKLFTLCATVALALGSSAQTWNEQGDAIDLLPGQITVGSGQLLQIVGALSAGSDVDLYCIFINDEANFSATTVGGAQFDTQLFLFRERVAGSNMGYGVTFNDDTGVTQSRITSAFVMTNDTYFIAVSGYDRDAVDAGAQAIWLDTPFGTERAPDGPGANNPLAGWDIDGFSGTYTITLSGATYHVPEPGTMLALAVGIAAVVARRRLR